MLVTFMCYIGLACIAFAPEAVAILGGDAYADSVYCVPPIALGIVCQSLYTHYVNIELHLKQTKYVSAATIFAACINLVLNAIMIPKYGYVAAAYTTLFSYMVLMVTHYLITIKVFKVKIYDDKFMFASLLVVFLISALLVMLYNTLLPRYALVGIGFISFIIVFKSRIAGFINKKTGSKS